MSPRSSTESYPAFARIGLRVPLKKPQPGNLPRPGFEAGAPGFAARRADRYSTGAHRRGLSGLNNRTVQGEPAIARLLTALTAADSYVTIVLSVHVIIQEFQERAVCIVKEQSREMFDGVELIEHGYAVNVYHGCGGMLNVIYDVSIICQPDRSRLVPVAWQQWSEMEALIPSPAPCEVRSVIKFFNAQSIAPIEIHRQLCQVYLPNIMSKQMVRRSCRQFSEGRQSVHDEERSGRPSLINDDRVELVRQCIMENRRFTISELSSHFPQISRSLLHEIVTKHLLFKKVCARWVPKNLTPEHKM
ncbi:hypothetical protein ANN_23414 [Periplaneta americana]|uniref:Uncharacterized protein n=1 Tax=Periplaneta americana TaxID=6978 RepID=A0ABQ8SLG4_PERAM|nr:hypothetical protein ANN_23414 [Periplaneta americana]